MNLLSLSDWTILWRVAQRVLSGDVLKKSLQPPVVTSIPPLTLIEFSQSVIVAWLLCGVHTEFGALPLGLLNSEHC